MSFAIAGLTNANEFYSQHYLDEILEKDLKPLFQHMRRGPKGSPPISARWHSPQAESSSSSPSGSTARL